MQASRTHRPTYLHSDNASQPAWLSGQVVLATAVVVRSLGGRGVARQPSRRGGLGRPRQPASGSECV